METEPTRPHRLFTSTDVEETETRIAAVMQPHRLRPIGRPAAHNAYMDFLRLPAIGIGAIGFGRMALHLDALADYHLMIFCRHGKARLTGISGEAIVGGTTAICIAPGDPLRGEFSADCEQLVVRIDAALLRRACDQREPRLRFLLDLGEPRLQPWLRLLDLATSDTAMIDLLLRDAHVAAGFESLLLATLLSTPLREEQSIGSCWAPASVLRAESFIDACYAQPLTLSHIATAAGVPERTLLDGFRHFRGTSPMRHLRHRRLDAAHVLLSKPGAASTVTEVALDCGFGHPGRFAAAYAQRYGQTPSTTLSGGRDR